MSTLALVKPSWQECLNQLQERISHQDFVTLVRPLQAEQQGDELVLWAPNPLVLHHVNQRFLGDIKHIVASLVAPPYLPPMVVLRVGSRDMPTVSTATHLIKELKPVETGLNSNFTLHNFVGESNQLPRAACAQAVENPVACSPLVLYGGVGLGKTHLLHAVGNAMAHKLPTDQLLYLSAARFSVEVVKAVQTNEINAFREKYCALDGIFLDDLQFLEGKRRSQEELCYIFDKLKEAQCPIVVACNRHPKEITGLSEPLSSRLGSGLVIPMESPTEQARVEILLSKAGGYEISLSEEIAEFIARCGYSNVRELEGGLKQVSLYVQYTGRPITVDLAYEALKHVDIVASPPRTKSVTIKEIQETVAEYYGIDRDELLSRTRRPSVVNARHLAMMLAKQYTHHSLGGIGLEFKFTEHDALRKGQKQKPLKKGRDHSNVCHALRRVRKHLDQGTIHITQDYNNLIRMLSGKYGLRKDTCNLQ
jgi:chromosomal replication initiator protein